MLPGMFGVMVKFPASFNTNFSNADFAASLFYNVMLWFCAALIFNFAHPQMKGGFVVKSLKLYGLAGLFFCSLSAIYMNHYVAAMLLQHARHHFALSAAWAVEWIDLSALV